MAASNQTSNGSKQFFKLKEVEEGENKGEFRFFEQKKTGDKWGDGETFNQLSGIVTNVDVKEYTWNGETKKNLIVTIHDVADTMEFSLGLRSMTAQSILNTLAGGNGFDLIFTCGKPKTKDGKSYPSLYINKPGTTQEERRTNWKWQISELPKVTTEMYKGNKIKVGQEEADAFWVEAVKFVKDQLGKTRAFTEGDKKVAESARKPEPQGDDLPF